MLVKGEKTKFVREAIQTLGLDANRAEAQAWLKQKYGVKASDVAESTFYNIRRALQQQATVAPDADAVARPPITTLVAENEQSAPVPTESQPTKIDNGIVALVRQLKLVVEKLGKNETKELVDVL